ncbi:MULTISPECIES: arylesterase [Comamonas]|uniref:Arylesterase n=1 Tax=Comamonas terrigena TaxID=32013 RepID=A0A2A7UW87_COMTR|nr:MULTISPECIES: arylesterase [Comamonas]MBD9531555.1 arylesterase [Comamonas sp. CMM01]MBV7417536.1 arylesterase [Comamonas sp. CMM03]MDH0051079.1 arylesterase [Comamonas terrigena]MDH0513522.1 arylesterase [Comamonas terrigena]MDH1093024.1 arylesterase [Comamonas terrigena]
MHPLHRHRRHCIALAGAAAALWLSPALAQGKTTARKILILGDSLSAEYGLARGTGWVTLLEQRLAQQHPNASVVNASISGETTAGGRSRLPALLKQHQPQIVVIELGGNDALRGLPLQQTEENLRLMLQVSKESGAKGLLVGMQMPPNYGASYGRDFAQIYTRVAQDTRTPLVPFLLKGVADIPNAAALFQADRIHPRAEAQPLMLDNVWPTLRGLLG